MIWMILNDILSIRYKWIKMNENERKWMKMNGCEWKWMKMNRREWKWTILNGCWNAWTFTCYSFSFRNVHERSQIDVVNVVYSI